jgi:2-polyprenyl-3-methyl-5-hydroxy-6-metoxy-1,4-benzoquinol methylase
MRDEIVERLLYLNREFYQTFAVSFSETRQRLQPGVIRILETLPAEASVLDLGCGNGTLARHLRQIGHRGDYEGLDSSEALISIARTQSDHPQSSFVLADLSETDWDKDLHTPFDTVFAFAVLHHLPSEELRIGILRKARVLLSEGGFLAFSNWNFTTSPRLRARIVPWSRAELTDQDVDDGDFLLDWRRGGRGLRYVHQFDEEQLNQLAANTGFLIQENFLSDGEGGRLGNYHIWTPVKP